jgi:hypothetical protein
MATRKVGEAPNHRADQHGRLPVTATSRMTRASPISDNDEHPRQAESTSVGLLGRVGGTNSAQRRSAPVAAVDYGPRPALGHCQTHRGGGGLAPVLPIGAIPGLLPALRAVRMSPTEALWSISIRCPDPAATRMWCPSPIDRRRQTQLIAQADTVPRIERRPNYTAPA